MSSCPDCGGKCENSWHGRNIQEDCEALDAERLAQRFHELYEDAAPRFRWETQPRSRVAWDELPDENRALMVYVCEQIEGELRCDAGASTIACAARPPSDD